MQPKGPKWLVVFAGCLALSFLLHFFSGEVLHREQPLPHSVASNEIKVRIVETPAKKTPPQKSAPQSVKSVAKSQPNTSGKPTAAKPIPVKTDDDEEEETERGNGARTPRYEDLLPGRSWGAGTIAAGEKGGGSSRAPASTGTQKIAAHLAGQLDIPLVYREKTAESRAVAKFRKKANNWYFEYIDGDPVLRAVIYQAFRKPENLAKINDLGRELGKEEILFVLSQLTKPALSGFEEFSDRIEYSGNKITYSRTILTGDDGSAGMPLPDKEAERAVMRDQVALKRLLMSPAYISPIRNREIQARRD